MKRLPRVEPLKEFDVLLEAALKVASVLVMDSMDVMDKMDNAYALRAS